VQIFRNGFLRRCFPLLLKLTARSLDVTASKCFFHRPRASARCTTSAAGDVWFGTNKELPFVPWCNAASLSTSSPDSYSSSECSLEQEATLG
jgi:hypothetical protein